MQPLLVQIVPIHCTCVTAAGMGPRYMWYIAIQITQYVSGYVAQTMPFLKPQPNLIFEFC